MAQPPHEMDEIKPNNDNLDALSTCGQGRTEERKMTVGWTPYLVYCMISSVIGTSFMDGYNLAAVNAPHDHIKKFINDSFNESSGSYLTDSEMTTQWALVASLFLVGGTLGSIWIPKKMADRFGQKRSLLYISPIGVVGGLLCFVSRYSDSYVPLYIGRFVLGVHTGIGLVILPSILSEIAPVHLQGAVGASNALGLVTGVAVANLLGLPWLLGSKDLYHVLFMVASGIYIAHAVLLYFAAESPVWLAGNNKDEVATETLEKLRKGANQESLAVEIERIKEDCKGNEESQSLPLKEFFKSRHLWWPMILIVNLAMTLSLTGIGIVLMFASDVMSGAGLDRDMAAVANFGLAIVNILSTILAMTLVDRLGRKPLMLISLAGAGVSLVFLTVVIHLEEYYASIAGLALFLVAYAVGCGALPWFLAVELLIPAAKQIGLTIALFVIWASYLALSLAFPFLQEQIEEYAFLPFAGFAFFELVFLFCFQPETKSTTPWEIADMYLPGKSLFKFGTKRKGNEESQTSCA